MKKQTRWFAYSLASVLVIGALLCGCSNQSGPFKILLRGVKADTIRYSQGTLNYQVAVIERDGKFGLINYQGEIVAPVENDEIVLTETQYGSGVTMLRAIRENGNQHLETTFEADGTVSDVEAGGFGYDPEAEPYWYNGAFTSHSEATELSYEKSWHPKYNRLGTIVLERQRVIPVQEMKGYTTNEYGGIVADLVSENYALLDYDTKTLLTDFVYEDVSYIGFADGVLPVKKGGKWGYVNEKGEALTEFIYDVSEIGENGQTPKIRMYASTNGYTVVHKGDAWGLIDNQGNTIAEPVYEDISQVNDKGQFWFKKNGKWSLAEIVT